jgi:hypothetical protein
MNKFAVNWSVVSGEIESLVEQTNDCTYTNARVEVIAHDLDELNLQWKPLLRQQSEPFIVNIGDNFWEITRKWLTSYWDTTQHLNAVDDLHRATTEQLEAPLRFRIRNPKYKQFDDVLNVRIQSPEFGDKRTIIHQQVGRICYGITEQELIGVDDWEHCQSTASRLDFWKDVAAQEACSVSFPIISGEVAEILLERNLFDNMLERFWRTWKILFLHGKVLIQTWLASKTQSHMHYFYGTRPTYDFEVWEIQTPFAREVFRMILQFYKSFDTKSWIFPEICFPQKVCWW